MRICNPHDQQNTTSEICVSFFYQTQGRHSIKTEHIGFSRENLLRIKKYSVLFSFINTKSKQENPAFMRAFRMNSLLKHREEEDSENFVFKWIHLEIMSLYVP